MSGLYGPPGAGKSMLALDWALSVSTGRPWLDHPVQQGYALYIAAEGHSGQAKRARAWLQKAALTATAVPNFGFVKERIAITEASEDYDVLFSRLEEEVQRVPTFVIIDTLARSIDGDENISVDMVRFLNAAERWCEEYGATVLVIHHGNAAGVRERGHTAFKGTVGALLKLGPVQKHKDILCLHTDKQRDAIEAPDVGLKTEVVEGTDSVVLVAADLPDAHERGHGLSPPMRKVDMLTYLGGHPEGLRFDIWEVGCQVPHTTFVRRVRRLLEEDCIYKKEGRYYASPSTVDVAALSAV